MVNYRCRPKADIKQERQLDSDRVNRWLTLGANVAVLAGIIFLGFELRQNTIASQIEAGNSLENGLRELELFVAGSSEFAEILEKGRDGDDITSTEQLRLFVFYRSVFRQWQNAYFQYRSGALDADVWRGQKYGYANTLNDDIGLRNHWQSNRTMYTAEFDELLESMLTQPNNQ